MTVTLEWTHINGVSYSISVDPMVTVNYMGRNHAKIVMMYDSKYNVSVVASLCGINRTTFITINQGKLNNIMLSWTACIVIKFNHIILRTGSDMPSSAVRQCKSENSCSGRDCCCYQLSSRNDTHWT